MIKVHFISGETIEITQEAMNSLCKNVTESENEVVSIFIDENKNFHSLINIKHITFIETIK